MIDWLVDSGLTFYGRKYGHAGLLTLLIRILVST
jgi:hypothetical protein